MPKAEVAVIGMACRFPGARSVDAFARLLESGESSIVPIPPERWDVDAFFDPAPGKPGRSYARHAGLIDQVDRFDATAFGISPKEAAAMDPQQRLLLEVAAEAFADAGIPRRKLKGAPVGVFVGISTLDYIRLQPPGVAHVNAYAGSGNALSIAANRISYVFGLEGPSLAIDTACSSSLVAVHLAVSALVRGEVSLALVAGVNLLLAPDLMVAFSAARMLAADGRCKTFDAAADGYVRGEGAGALVLKRAEQAIADADRVRARMLGSAVNQDGRSNGLTAPSGPRQTAVIRSALKAAGVSAQRLAYVEAHGTGTPLGDPIEALALADALDPAPDRPCLLGSVKTNLGHLEAAAGIAGAIKTVLLLERRLIPPSLHFTRPNPEIPFERLPVAVVDRATPWPDDPLALAGVSSFGFGGTNAHVIFAPPASAGVRRWPEPAPWPLLVSGASAEAVARAAAGLAEVISRAPELLPALSVTLMARASHYEYRAGVVAGTATEALEAFAALAADGAADESGRIALGGSGADAGALARIRRRPRKRPRRTVVDLPADGRAAGWPTDWPEPPSFLERLGLPARPTRAPTSARALLEDVLAQAVAGVDLAWETVLPRLQPVALPPPQWQRRLFWFDPARAPSVGGAARRWLAGLPVKEGSHCVVELDGPAPADLPGHGGLLPLSVGLAMMAAVVLRSIGPARLDEIRVLRPLAMSERLVLSARGSGGRVTVGDANDVWMEAGFTAEADWPEHADDRAEGGLEASGPAAALAVLMERAATATMNNALPVGLSAFVPADPGAGPWNLAGDCTSFRLGASRLEQLRFAGEATLPVVEVRWIEIGWRQPADFARRLDQALAAVPSSPPVPAALSDGLSRAAAGFALDAISAACAGAAAHPGLPRLKAIANAAEPAAAPRELAACLAEAFPDHRDEIELFARCGGGWAQILSGERSGLELLLDPDDPERLLRVYRDGPANRRPNALTRATVAALLQLRGPGRPLRVVELGAGTGATTEILLPLMPEGSRYLATDLAAGLLASLQSRLGRQGALEVALVDAARPLGPQGLAAGSFDLVVAANVLHALADPGACVREVGHLLAPGGVLILQELTRGAPWLDLVFGLVEGWWSGARTDGALLDRAGWVRLLAANGFRLVAGADSSGTATEGSQTVLLATPEAAEPVHRLPADPVAASAQVAALGRPQGAEAITLALPSGSGGLAWARSLAAERQIRIGHLAMFDSAEPPPDRLVADLEPQLRLHGDSVKGLRLIRAERRQAPLPRGSAVLILGGTGGLGRLLALELLRDDAERVVLAGRTASDDHPAVASVREALIDTEKRIETVSIDLGDQTAAYRWIEAILAGGVRTIIHAAGSYVAGADALTAPALAEARAAKPGGLAAALDAISAFPEAGLVMLSSAAAILGLPGAAAYAVANAEAEDLVHAARSRGRPVTYLALGPVADTGMAIRAGAARWRRFGIRQLAPAAVVRAVIAAAADPTGFEPALMVDIDWATARPFLAFGDDGRHLSLLLPPPVLHRPGRTAAQAASPSARVPIVDTPAAVVPAGSSLSIRLPGFADGARDRTVEDMVAAAVAAVLHLPSAEEVEREAGLMELGLDSLTAIELAGRLSQETGITLPPTLAIDHPSVSALGRHILARLDAPTSSPHQSPAASLPVSNHPGPDGPDREAIAGLSDAAAWQLLVAGERVQ
jgi:3-oxoacyl-(acyl-carrier-protein) synthase/SAM-dependent methyltransferase/acyl carrier protein/short-subunit dehydrogenase